jgi:hypothetical protein
LESRSVSIAWKIIMINSFAVLLFGLIFTFVPDVLIFKVLSRSLGKVGVRSFQPALKSQTSYC